MAYFHFRLRIVTSGWSSPHKTRFHTRLYGVMLWFWSSATIRKTPNQFLPDCPVESLCRVGLSSLVFVPSHKGLHQEKCHGWAENGKALLVHIGPVLPFGVFGPPKAK
ncbi:hypothetical protein PISMIDRAFT_553444 [Pisolithus microcarpus 441]|uniref:Uncharacterized protein n=1 Tax=Pisolithus microcarpus 441 TaxID=765257 RepID=A0A0C9ZHP0_9AGAM|nr:hypothetical protein PISMIDRAFT_553444 [Pisolithus microcarpus 441]